jgi:hypothetical protein
VTYLPSEKSLDCASFEDRIHRILDDRLTLTGDELLMDHAAKCESCAQVLADYDSVDDSIKLLPDEIDRILREAKEFDVTLGLGSFATRHLGLIATLAAMVVIGIGIFNLLNTDQPAKMSGIANRPVPSIPSSIPNSLAIAKIGPKSTRKTPDSSPFSPNFSVASSLQIMNIPPAPKWDEFSKRLDSLEPVITYSTELPAIRPVQCSLDATLRLLKKSFSKSPKKTQPDLGFSIDSRLLAAV